MSLSEFDIIKNYFSNIGPERDDVPLGVGDDCAILAPGKDVNIVVTVDNLVKGVHFDDLTPVDSIAYKAVMVSVSDIAAMGADPAWLNLALTLPDADQHWLQQFSQGLREACDVTGVRLVGGNISRGPLNISTHLTGLLQNQKALYRSGASVGDNIYVSGYLGEAALGLMIHQQKIAKNNFDLKDRQYLLSRLYKPTARISTGLALQSIASACIDISDGLMSDLGHLLTSSKCGAIVELTQLPVHACFESLFEQVGQWKSPLCGGEDYELCFTAANVYAEKIQQISQNLDVKLTHIGRIENEVGIKIMYKGEIMPLTSDSSLTGYTHFC